MSLNSTGGLYHQKGQVSCCYAQSHSKALNLALQRLILYLKPAWVIGINNRGIDMIRFIILIDKPYLWSKLYWIKFISFEIIWCWFHISNIYPYRSCLTLSPISLSLSLLMPPSLTRTCSNFLSFCLSLHLRPSHRLNLVGLSPVSAFSWTSHPLDMELELWSGLHFMSNEPLCTISFKLKLCRDFPKTQSQS